MSEPVYEVRYERSDGTVLWSARYNPMLSGPPLRLSEHRIEGDYIVVTGPVPSEPTSVVQAFINHTLELARRDLMPNEPTKFRKKPVVIEALRYDGRNAQAVMDWMDPSRTNVSGRWNDGVFTIKTLEGEMTAQRGDWIIKGVAGEFYPCKPDIFEATYEPVE